MTGACGFAEDLYLSWGHPNRGIKTASTDRAEAFSALNPPRADKPPHVVEELLHAEEQLPSALDCQILDKRKNSSS